MVEGKYKEIGLGRYPEISLAVARLQRNEILAKRRQGIDPVEERKLKKAEACKKAEEDARTFQFVAMDWFNTQTTANTAKTRQSTLGRLNLHILPSLANKVFSEIAFDDFVAIVRGLESAGKYEMAKRVSEIIVRICRHAKIMRWSTHNIAEGLTRIREKRPASCKKGLPAITSKEGVAEMLRRIKAYVESSRSTQAMKGALLLYPLTAVRAQELYLAEWDEIDFDGRIWRIPGEHMKCSRPHDVPLSDQALQIFRNLWEYRVSNKKIFPSGSSKGYITCEAVNQRMHASGITGQLRSAFPDRFFAIR